MENVVILGCARSGTSMLAEVFHRSGYHLGPELMGPKEGNPHGYFESREVEAINEDLLDECVPPRPAGRGARLRRFWHMRRPNRPRRWLLALRRLPKLKGSDATDARIEALAARQPFCFKDPRFVHTLPYWERRLPPLRRICVFRAPLETAASVRREMKAAGHEREVRLSDRRLVALWARNYRRALDQAAGGKPMLFVHYADLLDGGARPAVEAAAGGSLDWSGVEPGLRRSGGAGGRAPRAVRALYRELLARSGRFGSETET